MHAFVFPMDPPTVNERSERRAILLRQEAIHSGSFGPISLYEKYTLSGSYNGSSMFNILEVICDCGKQAPPDPLQLSNPRHRDSLLGDPSPLLPQTLDLVGQFKRYANNYSVLNT